MLIPNHPDPERLSALASGDTDATDDTSLADHVSTCVRCTALVDELGALRMSLAELPDLLPHRPLRLLPEVADQPARIDRVGGWARRFFAPVLTAGAALAMVGLIGTTVPALDNLAQSGAASTDRAEAFTTDPANEAEASQRAVSAPGAEDSGGVAPGETDQALNPLQSGTDGEGVASGGARDDDDAEMLGQDVTERSPWPMVLFTGVALMIAAGILRWILAPRVA